MITQNTINDWKKSKDTYYLGRWRWLNLVSESWKSKSKYKMKSENFKQVDLDKKVKKYFLYRSADGTKSIAMVTMGDVSKMKAAGIKVYAEKDGFLC